MKLPFRIPPRAAAAVFVLLAVAAFMVHSTRSARMTMVNVGIAIEYAPRTAVVLLCLGLAAAAIALVTPSIAARIVGLSLALAVLCVGADNLIFQITADRTAIHTRGFARRSALAWTEIAKVDVEGTAVVILDLAGRPLRLELDRLTEQQRSAFHRTVSRRIWEAGPAQAR